MKKIVYQLVLKGYILNAQHNQQILRSDCKTLNVWQGNILYKNDCEVEVGSDTFLNVPIVFENDITNTKIKNSSYRQLTSLIGMYLLKQFNMILDFQNLVIYLKANNSLKIAFRNKAILWYVKISMLDFLMGGVGCFFYITRAKCYRRGITILMGVFSVIILSYQVRAQQAVPVIKAISKKVAIKDGDEGITKFWNHLEQTAQPVTYPLAKNLGSRRVVFYTDIDSVAFTVQPNATYPFKVVLNNLDTCNAILSTVVYKPMLTADRVAIPFTLRNGKEILITGSVNETTNRNFLIDLGARYNYLIGKEIDKKSKVIIDGHVEDESVAGLTTEAISSSNRINFGKFVLEDVPICIINDDSDIEGLIGHRAFEGTIMELNFDSNNVFLHPKLPAHAFNYTKIPIKQTTGGIYIYLTFSNGNKQVGGWFFIDTGADNFLSLDARFVAKNRLIGTLKKIGEGTLSSSGVGSVNMELLEIPVVNISHHEFQNVPAVLAQQSFAEADFEDGVIGIELLKRFNIIIDFPGNTMYLQPNKHFAGSFKKKKVVFL